MDLDWIYGHALRREEKRREEKRTGFIAARM